MQSTIHRMHHPFCSHKNTLQMNELDLVDVTSLQNYKCSDFLALLQHQGDLYNNLYDYLTTHHTKEVIFCQCICRRPGNHYLEGVSLDNAFVWYPHDMKVCGCSLPV